MGILVLGLALLLARNVGSVSFLAKSSLESCVRDGSDPATARNITCVKKLVVTLSYGADEVQCILSCFLRQQGTDQLQTLVRQVQDSDGWIKSLTDSHWS
jgi:hypothetical protein